MLLAQALTAPLRGDANVEKLQRSLQNLSQALQRPAIFCQITGVMDDQTMMSISAALDPITEQLPSSVFVALKGAMMIGETTDTAKQFATQYAVQLSTACDAAAVKFKTQSQSVAMTFNPPGAVAPTSTNPFATLFPVGWYKQPWGMALIALGAFAIWKLFFAAPTKA